ncbi:hypothetical protein [Streptomyces sp. NPDC002758]
MGTKKELTLVGFPAEQTRNDEWSIERLLGRSSSPPRPDEARIAGYLRNAQAYIVSPGVTVDLLDGDGPIGTGTILTDGEFAWPDDLAHYLETYHIELPQLFVDAIVAANFEPPTLTIHQLRGITLPDMA